MKRKEFTTRTELKSLTRSIKCAETECVRLRMLSECLGWLLHAPSGPFYSPKAARSRWRPTRKAILAFCRVVHRTVTVACPVRISFLISAQPTVADSWQLAHQTLSGAHRTVQCPCRPLARATRRPRIARPTVVLAAAGSPDSPVNYSRTPPNSP
jgi:hypothetical protein